MTGDDLNPDRRGTYEARRDGQARQSHGRQPSQHKLRLPYPPEACLAFKVEPVGERQFGRNRQQQHRVLGKEEPPFARLGSALQQRAGHHVAAKRRGLGAECRHDRKCPGIAVAGGGL